ncbi:MAG TPA: hypothetical protein VM261_23760 [Kofleriaceae bacterium]|nr:hypothetical protein [Kofleriaceae bacterium]
MGSPVAPGRWRTAPFPRTDVAIIVVALAAFAATFVPMPDPHFVFVCTCEDSMRFADLLVGVPAISVAFLAAIRILSGHSGGIARQSAHALATIGVALAFALILAIPLEGRAYLANAVTHAALLALILTRFLRALHHARHIRRQ